MKKYLEILMEEDGRFHFSSDFEPVVIRDAHRFDSTMKQMIRSLADVIKEGPKKGPNPVCSSIRMASMAEIIIQPQPYSQMEELWSHMMFETIAHFEDFLRRVKKEKGLKEEILIRPQMFFPGQMIFPLGKKGFN